MCRGRRYFLNAETINDAGKIALSVLIFLINGCFLMVFFFAIKKEFVRKAKEIAKTVKIAKKQVRYPEVLCHSQPGCSRACVPSDCEAPPREEEPQPAAAACQRQKQFQPHRGIVTDTGDAGATRGCQASSETQFFKEEEEFRLRCEGQEEDYCLEAVVCGYSAMCDVLWQSICTCACFSHRS